jgi:phage gpG-like protein
MSALSFTLTRDDFTPMIRRAEAAGKNPTPLLRAMGTTFMSITMGNFHGGTGFRPIPWVAKKDGSPSNLQQSGNLSRSFHLVVTQQAATVGTPVIYAAVHQLGFERGTVNVVRTTSDGQNFQNVSVKNQKGGTPPRPFFPVNPAGDQLTPAANTLVIRAGERALGRLLQKT